MHPPDEGGRPGVGTPGTSPKHNPDDQDSLQSSDWDQLDLFDQVPRARTLDPTREHEAQWTPAILTVIASRVPRGTRVHDPFAGTGHRLGQVADAHDWIFTGTEQVPEFIVDPRVVVGDATDPCSYPTGEHMDVTSPPYPNGMNDHFKASDPVGRHTYRAALHRLLGYDRPLGETNLGRYNYRYGAKSVAKYWQLADAVVACWTAARVIVNVKDVPIGGKVEPVADLWAELLERHGYRIVERIPVPCPGQRHGANRERVDHEDVIIGERR